MTLIVNYRPLVEMMVLNKEGRLLARRSMNEDIMENFPRSWEPDQKLLHSFNGFLSEASRASGESAR